MAKIRETELANAVEAARRSIDLLEHEYASAEAHNIFLEDGMVQLAHENQGLMDRIAYLENKVAKLEEALAESYLVSVR